ncbi:MAG: DsrE family protein, partial [Planctomycetes bacterium]|nr:DsrE family protein [Planctomycetota bacterium]
MIRRNLLILLLVAGSAALAADGPSMGPVIKDYGPTYAIEWRDVPLPENQHYKMVFDLAAVPEEGKVNRNLVSVARYLNMHARNGVPTDHMSLAVVVHGKAVRNLLQESAHQQRHGTDNPNVDLIQSLQAAGVRF